jgi:hypothetical protein
LCYSDDTPTFICYALVDTARILKVIIIVSKPVQDARSVVMPLTVLRLKITSEEAKGLSCIVACVIHNVEAKNGPVLTSFKP